MGSNLDHDWTDARVTTLKKLWVGGLSAGQIAKQLGGVSRCAVIGKVHRLKLPERAVAAMPGRAPTWKAPPVKREPYQYAGLNSGTKATGQPTRPEIHEAPGSATILTLGAHMCKWPIGDPSSAEFSFCGRRTGGAQGPYCEGHAAVAYQRQSANAAKRDQRGINRLAGRTA